MADDKSRRGGKGGKGKGDRSGGSPDDKAGGKEMNKERARNVVSEALINAGGSLMEVVVRRARKHNLDQLAIDVLPGQVRTWLIKIVKEHPELLGTAKTAALTFVGISKWPPWLREGAKEFLDTGLDELVVTIDALSDKEAHVDIETHKPVITRAKALCEK